MKLDTIGSFQCRKILCLNHGFSISAPTIQYTKTYPSTVPTLELKNRRGISEDDQEELLEVLIKQAQEQVGEVMVYELILQAGGGGGRVR